MFSQEAERCNGFTNQLALVALIDVNAAHRYPEQIRVWTVTTLCKGLIMTLFIKRALLVVSMIGLAASWSGPAAAGDCTGYVVGVRPISQYNHARGNGFLAVRTGPGSKYQQTGEVYRGDEVSVYDRRGNWYAITCMSGRCENPKWGAPMPSGWAYKKYIDADGVCP